MLLLSFVHVFVNADARDSIAKVAYGRVFGWIVSKINELLAPNVDLEMHEIGEFINLLKVFLSFEYVDISLKCISSRYS